MVTYYIDDMEVKDFSALCAFFSFDADARDENGRLKFIDAEDVAREIVRRNGGVLTGHRITVYYPENEPAFTHYNC